MDAPPIYLLAYAFLGKHAVTWVQRVVPRSAIVCRLLALPRLVRSCTGLCVRHGQLIAQFRHESVVVEALVDRSFVQQQVDREAWMPPEHQVERSMAGGRMLGAVIRVHHRLHVALPVRLFFWVQGAEQVY